MDERQVLAPLRDVARWLSDSRRSFGIEFSDADLRLRNFARR